MRVMALAAGRFHLFVHHQPVIAEDQAEHGTATEWGRGDGEVLITPTLLSFPSARALHGRC
jgi:hypothetical protein